MIGTFTKKYGVFVVILSNNNYALGLEYLAENSGSLRIIKECLIDSYIAFLVEKNSEFRKIFDFKISQ